MRVQHDKSSPDPKGHARYIGNGRVPGDDYRIYAGPYPSWQRLAFRDEYPIFHLANFVITQALGGLVLWETVVSNTGIAILTIWTALKMQHHLVFADPVVVAIMGVLI